VGYIYYDYPQDEGVLGDYEEVYGNVSFGGFSAGFAFSDEYWFETGEIVISQSGLQHDAAGRLGAQVSWWVRSITTWLAM